MLYHYYIVSSVYFIPDICISIISVLYIHINYKHLLFLYTTRYQRIAISIPSYRRSFPIEFDDNAHRGMLHGRGLVISTVNALFYNNVYNHSDKIILTKYQLIKILNR